MNNYDHLPNAKYIDLLLNSLKDKCDVEIWNDVFSALSLKGYIDDEKMVNIWDDCTYKIDKLSRNDIFQIIKNHIFSGFVCNSHTNGTGSMIILDAILVLLTYDDCGYLLESELSEIELLGKLGMEPAIMLWAAAMVLQKIKESHV